MIGIAVATLGLGVNLMGISMLKRNKLKAIYIISIGNGIMIFSMLLKGI